MALSPSTMKILLDEFADWLEFEGIGRLDLLVCGGTAMGLQGLHDRVTKDVDVLGSWDCQLLEATCMDDFPANVRECIHRVAINHPELRGLKKSWVNLGPQDLTRQGLPPGYESRLCSQSFGKGSLLTLHMLDREDLIALKLFAAGDRFSARQDIHLDDLRVLKATFDELDRALEWAKTLRRFDEMRPEIQSVLERLGYHDLAGYV